MNPYRSLILSLSFFLPSSASSGGAPHSSSHALLLYLSINTVLCGCSRQVSVHINSFGVATQSCKVEKIKSSFLRWGWRCCLAICMAPKRNTHKQHEKETRHKLTGKFPSKHAFPLILFIYSSLSSESEPGTFLPSDSSTLCKQARSHSIRCFKDRVGLLNHFTHWHTGIDTQAPASASFTLFTPKQKTRGDDINDYDNDRR